MIYTFRDGYRPASHHFKLFASCILFFILLHAPDCNAQENKDREWMLGAGFVASRVNNVDNTFSSLTYSGTNIGGSLLARYQNENSFHEINAYYSGGTLKTSGHANTLTNNYLNIGYANLYKIGSTNNALKFCGGGGVDILYAQRNHNDFVNNSYSFEFASSISGVFEISYLFNNETSGFSITDRLHVPFISAVKQTAFGNDNSSGDLHIVSFSFFVRFKNSLMLEKNISSRQKLGLGYTWDFYHLDDVHEIKQASHELALTYCYIF